MKRILILIIAVATCGCDNYIATARLTPEIRAVMEQCEKAGATVRYAVVNRFARVEVRCVWNQQ